MAIIANLGALINVLSWPGLIHAEEILTPPLSRHCPTAVRRCSPLSKLK